MINLIQHDPIKVIIFFLIFGVAIIWLTFNLQNREKIFFYLIFYIPISFRSLSGTLSLYLIAMLTLWTLIDAIKVDENRSFSFDSLLIVLIFIASSLSILNADDLSLFYRSEGRIRLDYNYLSLLAVFASIGVYIMTKRFVDTEEKLLKLISFTVISGSIATFAGYLQIVNPGNTFIFKYIVIGESIKWSRRIAATMQGYEFLAEYSMILILFSMILFYISKTSMTRLLYAVIIINFLIVMTLTQVRGIYIAIVAALLYLTFLMLFLGRVKTSFKILSYSLLAITVLVGTILFIDFLKPGEGFTDRFKQFEAVDISKGNYGTRTEVWDYGVKVIQQMSLSEKIFGAGHKYFGVNAKHFKAGGWPHNLYFSYLIRDGVVGLFLLLCFFIWLYKESLLAVYRAIRIDDRQEYFVAVILHLVLIIIVVDEFKIEFIRHDRSSTLIWLFFGIIAVNSQRIKSLTYNMKYQ